MTKFELKKKKKKIVGRLQFLKYTKSIWYLMIINVHIHD